MRKLLFLSLFVMARASVAQNLIPNPGFDIITECPYDYNQITFAPPWVRVSQGFWMPNLMNECSDAEYFFKVPHAGAYVTSYQPARSGGGYAQLLVYRDVNFENLQYIGTPLSARMEKGTAYYIEFYVSPDPVNLTTIVNNWIYTDAVGMGFTAGAYFEEVRPNQPISIRPAIEHRGTLITDTVGWTRVSGCHISDGTEQFAIIGNFRGTDETMVQVGNTNISPYNNYFYIEDVTVVAFDPLPDTLLLCGDTQWVGGGFLDAAYRWSTGATDSVINVTEPGLYVLEALMENCVLRDTVRVLDGRWHGGYPRDTSICSGEALGIAPGIPGSYRWSDGTDADQITVGTPGIYAATVTNTCGEAYFSTRVDVERCGCEFYIPNAFSQNGDGINDKLEVYAVCDFDYEIVQFSVFDRWGNPLHISKGGTTAQWDGKKSGVPMGEGTYAWFLEYEVTKKGATERKTLAGDVVILR